MKALAELVKEKQEKKKEITPVYVEDKTLTWAIDEALEAQNGIHWKQSDTFPPSGNNECPRYLQYRLKGFDQQVEFKGQTRRIFDLGNRVEDWLGETFDDLGILIDSQKQIVLTDPPVMGYIDFIIEWDGPKIIECKSINANGFLYRKNYMKPKDEHFKQIQWYLRAEDLKEGYVFYYNKNDSELLPIKVERDDVFLDKLAEKYGKIYKAFKEGTQSIRPYKQNSKNCKRCDARDFCWADQEVGVKIT